MLEVSPSESSLGDFVLLTALALLPFQSLRRWRLMVRELHAHAPCQLKVSINESAVRGPSLHQRVFECIRT